MHEGRLVTFDHYVYVYIYIHTHVCISTHMMYVVHARTWHALAGSQIHIAHQKVQHIYKDICQKNQAGKHFGNVLSCTAISCPSLGDGCNPTLPDFDPCRCLEDWACEGAMAI